MFFSAAWATSCIACGVVRGQTFGAGQARDLIAVVDFGVALKIERNCLRRDVDHLDAGARQGIKVGLKISEVARKDTGAAWG